MNYGTLDMTGGVLYLNYNNGTYDEILLTDESVKITGSDYQQMGQQSIQAEYHVLQLNSVLKQSDCLWVHEFWWPVIITGTE